MKFIYGKKGHSGFEIVHNLVRVVLESRQPESPGQCLCAIELEFFAVIDWVCGHAERKQALIGFHTFDANLVKKGLGAIDDGNSARLDDFGVGWRHYFLSIRGQDDTVEFCRFFQSREETP